MAEDKPPKPDPAHLARFRKVMSALVAVPKDEAFKAFVQKELKEPKRLDGDGKVKPHSDKKTKGT